jgi:hypothetical protein
MRTGNWNHHRAPRAAAPPAGKKLGAPVARGASGTSPIILREPRPQHAVHGRLAGNAPSRLVISASPPSITSSTIPGCPPVARCTLLAARAPSSPSPFSVAATSSTVRDGTCRAGAPQNS